MSSPTSSLHRASVVTAVLAAGKLRTGPVLFFLITAAAPFVVTAGVIPTAYGLGLTGIPVAFLAVAAVLALFCVGYVAMARHVTNAGAMYAYIARGLGKPAGVAAAWVALAAYNCMQVGLYGGFGVAVGPLLADWAGIHPPWWLIAGAAWALVGVLGMWRVEVNGRVLSVLLVAELAVITVFNIADLLHPAGGHVSVAAWDPHALVGPGVGALLVVAATVFVGFEAGPVLGEETRDPRRTIPRATYLCLAGMAGLYALSAWAPTVAVGPDRIGEVAARDGADTVFNLAAAQLGHTAAQVGHVLFATSLFAAMISFHNFVARYTFALGRERVLFARLGHTDPRTGAPRNASLAQSLVGLAVIAGYAIGGLDPLVELFFWLGTIGGFGVLLLICGTAVAIPVFFARNRTTGEGAWRRYIAPAIAAIALLGAVVLAVVNFAALLGVDPHSPLTVAFPAGYAVVAVAGAGWALVLRAAKPAVYAGIGLGANSITGQAVPAPLTEDPDATAASGVGESRTDDGVLR